jgi:hypothetical protein
MSIKHEVAGNARNLCGNFFEQLEVPLGFLEHSCGG